MKTSVVWFGSALAGAIVLGTGTASVAAPPSNSASASQFLPLSEIKRIRAERAKSGKLPIPALKPLVGGQPLKLPFKNILGGLTPDLGAKIKTEKGVQKVDPKLYAQAFPRPVPPASPRALPAARPQTPKWVRYPLEFQLAGIGLGTRAVDKDRFNRIDRYGLFAVHGNPSAVVRSVPQALAGVGEGAVGGGTPAPAGEAGAEIAPPIGTNITLQQQPPELSTLFPQVSNDGGLPGWALAVTVQLDNNHVEWLYQRDTYSMGFVVDRLGFVDAIIVSGERSPIANTQLEDPIHTVRLGDDLRKVLFRYGYPDDIVPLAADPAATANSATGAPGGGAGGTAPAPVPGVDASVAGGAAPLNAAYRTYDLRYEQTYNVVFTIRNNRVVRMYIFGDPDFFNEQRRQILRNQY